LRAIPETRNSPNNIEARLQYAQWFSEHIPYDRRSVIFIDECGFNLHLRRKFGRAKIGENATILVPASKGRNVSMAAALNEDGMVYLKIRIGGYNAFLFKEFLDEVFAKLHQKNLGGCTLVMDNVSFHKTDAIRAFVAAHGHTVVYLPPYSPMLNPIENCFSKIKLVCRTAEPLNSQDCLIRRIHEAADQVTALDAAGWLRRMDHNLRLCLQRHSFNE
jgi:transposase